MLTAILVAGFLQWNDLEPANKYILTSDIQISEGVKLSKGDAFTFEDSYSDEAPVIYFVFKNLMCTDSSLKSEMVLFNPEPEDQAHDKSIGVELEENCLVGIYVEPQFYYNKSVFSESALFRPQSNARLLKP